LDVLAVTSETPEGLSLADLARATGLKSPTAHKLARTLLSRGFLEKTRRPVRYRLGRSLLDLADANRNNSLVQRATPLVRKIFESLQCATVLLCQDVHQEVTAMVRMTPERPGFVERPSGRFMSPYGTASALLFQAFWTEEERAAYRKKYPFWEFGSHLWNGLEELDRFLDDARDKGYALPPLQKKGTVTMAAPIYGAGGVLLASLGASVPASKADTDMRKRLVNEVLQAARGLTCRQ